MSLQFFIIYFMPPPLQKNHINLSKFTKDNAVYLNFILNHYLVKSSILGFKWSLDVILYEFPSLQRQPLSLSNSVSSVFPIGNTTSTHYVLKYVDPSFFTWYLRFVHSKHIIFHKCDIPISIEDVTEFSSACCVGKLHRSPSSLLQVFDVPVFYPIRPYNTHKLDLCSHECIMVGYFVSHKGYILQASS